MIEALLCMAGFVFIGFLLAVAGVAVWLVRQQGGLVGITSGESELALRDRAKAAHTDARSKKERKRDRRINNAVNQARSIFKRTMRVEPGCVQVDQKGRRIIWYDGMEFWFIPTSKTYDTVRVPHRWFLRGVCPNCALKCWSVPVRNVAELGAVLQTFMPLRPGFLLASAEGVELPRGHACMPLSKRCEIDVQLAERKARLGLEKVRGACG